MFRYSLSESPPLADLFAECEWRDWINQDYPNKRSQSQELLLSNEDRFQRKLVWYCETFLIYRRTGLEAELRARAIGDEGLIKTVRRQIWNINRKNIKKRLSKKRQISEPNGFVTCVGKFSSRTVSVSLIHFRCVGIFLRMHCLWTPSPWMSGRLGMSLRYVASWKPI